MLGRQGHVDIKSGREIETMREVCRLAAETLLAVGEIIRPGLSTEEINTFVDADTRRRGAWPAPLHYRGFPKSVCTSVNEVIVHGIPGPRVLCRGDIVNVDVTHVFQGFYGDTSATFYVGEPGRDARQVTEVARRCLDLGLAEVRPGARVGDIGAAIQEFAEAQGCSVVRDFTGHGIGRRFHEEPRIPHFGDRGAGIRLKAGMTFTVEPMVNLGDWRMQLLDDGWTAVTADGSLSAQFEHTVLVTETGHDVLTRRPGPLANSELFPDFFSATKAKT